MAPPRYAQLDREKTIVLEYWIPWTSKIYTSEYEQEYLKTIDTAKALVKWTEEHL